MPLSYENITTHLTIDQQQRKAVVPDKKIFYYCFFTRQPASPQENFKHVAIMNNLQSEIIARIIPVIMWITALGLVGIWTRDIVAGKFSGQGSFFKWREGENMLWPHICAEYLTSLGLIAGGTGLWMGGPWGLPVSLLSLGALVYSAINSSGWVFAEKERLPYGIPMWISLAGAVFSLIVLIAVSGLS